MVILPLFPKYHFVSLLLVGLTYAVWRWGTRPMGMTDPAQRGRLLCLIHLWPIITLVAIGIQPGSFAGPFQFAIGPFHSPGMWGLMPPPPPPPHPDLIHLPFLLLLVAHDIGTIAALLLVPGEYALLVIRLKRLPQAQVEGVTVLRIPGWTAFTFGLLRPRIYMTEAVWQSEHREAVLSHEREHVRRRDPLRRLTAISAQRLLWFLPFFRRLADQESFEAERVCDLRACQVVGRTRYARALLAFLDMRAEASLTPNLSACFGERPGAKDAALLERVRSLHAADKDATPLWFWPAFLGLYLLLLVLV